jgi:hypothetical protein
VKVDSVTLDNKPNLIANCGPAAANLFASGADRVVIVWDLHPAWQVNKQKPCRKQDRDSILQALQQAGVGTRPVFLVCIEAELEAWLLADRNALEAVLGRPTRAANVPNIRHPEREDNPKGRLERIFQENGRGPYTDRTHAIRIVAAMKDLQTLAKRCPTFVRFALKSLNLQL